MWAVMENGVEVSRFVDEADARYDAIVREESWGFELTAPSYEVREIPQGWDAA